MRHEDDLDPLTTKSVRETNRGILLMMLAALAAVTILGAVFGGMRCGGGVILGGGLAFINYYWLASSANRLFVEGAAVSTALLALKYALRYFAIGAVLLLIFWTGLLPVTAVIAGLSTFAIAVVAQGIRSIFTS